MCVRACGVRVCDPHGILKMQHLWKEELVSFLVIRGRKEGNGNLMNLQGFDLVLLANVKNILKPGVYPEWGG